MGRYAEAETLLRHSQRLCAVKPMAHGRSEGSAYADKRRANDSLARCLGKRCDDLGKLQEAEKLARDSWATRAQEWGADHADTRAARRFVDRLRSEQCRAVCEAMVAKVAATAPAPPPVAAPPTSNARRPPPFAPARTHAERVAWGPPILDEADTLPDVLVWPEDVEDARAPTEEPLGVGVGVDERWLPRTGLLLAVVGLVAAMLVVRSPSTGLQ